MKKEKLFKNKKRGQGFAEYALLAGGIIIIVGIALIALRGVFNNTGRYIRCLLRVATADVAAGAAQPSFAGCNACLRTDGTFQFNNLGDLCAN